MDQNASKTAQRRPTIDFKFKKSTRQTSQETYTTNTRISSNLGSFLDLKNLVSIWFFIYNPENSHFQDKTKKTIAFGSTFGGLLIDLGRFWGDLGRLGTTFVDKTRLD